ncbi:MAG: creatininase family protein [Bacillota bacterium]|nr:creatininase family protein [Bacillota bacterium]
MFDWLSTSTEVAESGVTTAIIPLGSIEQHGAALPLGTDFIATCFISKRVAEKINAYLLPGIPVGTCQEHTGGKGSVWVQPATYMAYLQDICLSLRANGFKRIAFILGHGGLWVVKPAVRQMNMMYPDVAVQQVCPSDAFRSHISKFLETPAGDDIHAGEGEASMMMYLAPEGTHIERAKDNVPAVGREFFDYVPILRFSPPGVWGYPSKATRVKGEKIMLTLSDLTADYLAK